MTIILSMIIKNESARIERFLRSVIPHIQGAVILDTGSTDGTQSAMAKLLFEGGVKAQIHQATFVDFSTSRNVALAHAREFSRHMPAPTYFLLADADMELVAEPGDFANLTGPAYTLDQRHGGLTYANVRLLRADAPAIYVGRTHEVLHVEGVQHLVGPHLVDHADGASRPEKYERDIRLLEMDLKDRPHDQRTLFYLARTYHDMGLHGIAAGHYDQRAALGGWDEEVFCAKLYAGRCYLAAGDETKGLDRLFAAHSFRPSRAEPLATLARHFRLKPDRQATALVFAEAAMAIPRPPDMLFVEDDAYSYGPMQDFAICAYYSSYTFVKRRGFEVCDYLATSREVPAHERQIARNNLMFYARSLEETFPGVRRVRIDFPREPGWYAMNASLLRQGDVVWMLQRVVNFTVDRVTGAYSMPDGITRTRNFLCRMSEDLQIESITELRIDPEPPVNFPWVQGFEDMRLFEDGGGNLWASATTRQLAENGLCEIVNGRIEGDRFVDWRVISDRSEQRNEKNWAPLIEWPFEWLYMHDPRQFVMIASGDKTIHITHGASNYAIDHFRGGSQWLPYQGGMIGVEHEVIEAFGPRKYLHRLVGFSERGAYEFTLPFHFHPLHDSGNQFVAGACWSKDGDELWVNYSINDCESWVAIIPISDINEALRCP